MVVRGVSKNAFKSRLNGRTKAIDIHIKKDTRMVIIVPLDISSNYLVIKNMREALPGVSTIAWLLKIADLRTRSHCSGTSDCGVSKTIRHQLRKGEHVNLWRPS
jgi:hypothetical protein